MSLHGGSTSPPKKQKRSGLGGFKPTGGGTPSSGGSYSPGSYSPTPPPSKSPSGSPFGGFKFPGMGGGTGGGGIWGQEPTGPGPTANWSEGTRTGIAVGAVALIVLALGLLVFGLLSGGKTKTPAAQAQISNVTKFVPPTTSAGGKTQMPITFSDGTTANLLYDPALDLANLGVSLFDSGTLDKFTRAGRQFQIDHGGASFVANQPAPGAPGVPGPGASTVPVLPAPTPTQGNYLDFKFGDWHVGVWEGVGDDLMSSTDDQAWAANMTGTQNAAGFLVLTAKPPLKMAAFGSAGGPSITIGDIFSTGVLMTPGPCSVPSGNNVSNNAGGVPVRVSQNASNHYEGDLCLKDKNMEFLAYGSLSFVQGVMDSVELNSLKPGPAR